MSKFLDENGLLYLWGKIKALAGGKVDKMEGKGLSTNDFTAAEKTKLEGLENYTLPAASADVLGGVKVGAGLAISQGILSATGGGTADSVDWANVQNKPDLALKSDLASVYRYKGSVAKRENLQIQAENGAPVSDRDYRKQAGNSKNFWNCKARSAQGQPPNNRSAHRDRAAIVTIAALSRSLKRELPLFETAEAGMWCHQEGAK